MNKDLVVKEDAKFGEQLSIFAKGLRKDSTGTTLGFSEDEMKEAEADAGFWNFIFPKYDESQSYAQAFTRYKNLLRHGSLTEDLGSIPSLTVPDTVPDAVDANIETRFRKKAAKAKSSNKYSKAIGELLGIEIPHSVVDRAYGKPVINISLGSGHPLLKWPKGDYEGVEIWANHGGDGGYVKMERVFKAPWVDHTPLPSPGTSAVWKYKMIYLFNGEPIGLWSDEITVTVYGGV